MKTSDVSRMSIRQKVGSVLNRNPTSLEAEREQAIQNFFITLQKVSFQIFEKTGGGSLEFDLDVECFRHVIKMTKLQKRNMFVLQFAKHTRRTHQHYFGNQLQNCHLLSMRFHAGNFVIQGRSLILSLPLTLV